MASSYPQFYDDKPVHNNDKKCSCSIFSITTLTARIVALASLIVAAAVVKTNIYRFENYDFTYSFFRSYKYMFYASIIGIVYSFPQLPFAVYYVRTKRHMINHQSYLMFDFYADKIVAFILATGSGAIFGSTMDTKKWMKDSSDFQDFEAFLTVEYVAATFILVGAIACGISSVHSSLALK